MEHLSAVLLVAVLVACMGAVGLGIACLVQLKELEQHLGYPRRRKQRRPFRLAGRGKLVPWPHNPPRNR